NLTAAAEQETLALLRAERLIRTKDPDQLEAFHDRIREAVVANLPPATLQETHLQLAQALEAGNAGPGILAYHFLPGGELTKGLRYSLVAARAAKAQYANGDAIAHYRQALQLLSSGSFLDDGEVTKRIRRVKEELARTLLQAGNYAEAATLFQECLA